jgi:hypothetical protein
LDEKWCKVPFISITTKKQKKKKEEKERENNVPKLYGLYHILNIAAYHLLSSSHLPSTLLCRLFLILMFS